MVRFAYVTGALMLMASPVGAQANPTQAPQAEEIATSDTSDARRIVCKREEQIGSRLAAKKVCLTVQEWEDRAKTDRTETERIQTGAGVRPGG